MKLGWVAVMMVAAACGKKDKTPTAEVKPAVGSGSAEVASTPPPTAAPAVVPPLPGDGERAFVADAPGLVEVTASGESKVIAPGTVTWCEADARGKVVWFKTDRGLSVFDLVERRVHPVIDGELDDIEVIVNWGKEQLGGEDPVAFTAGIELTLAGTPTLARKIGCDGDAAFNCYEDGDKPTDEFAATLKRVDAMKLADAAYLASIATRGATGSLWSPPPMPPKAPKPPKVDKKACEEEPDVCGKLRAIPGSPLWLVTTANSRGDFYHETRELYDAQTGEFLHVDAGTLARAKQPSGDGSDFGGMRIAPSGLLSNQGIVFSPAKVVYKPAGDGSSHSCGFAGGGWRMPGIRE